MDVTARRAVLVAQLEAELERANARITQIRLQLAACDRLIASPYRTRRALADLALAGMLDEDEWEPSAHTRARLGMLRLVDKAQ